MKILLYNMGYGTGLNGSFWQYCFKSWRYLWTPKKVIRKIMGLIKKERAQLVCLLETDAGSIRNRFVSQVQLMARTLGFPFYKSLCKYDPLSWWGRLPIFRKLSTTIFSEKKGIFVPHYLKTGMKRLVQEYISDGMSVFIIHLDLFSKKTRQKQLKELSIILKKCRRPYVVCGDFNITKGLPELQKFLNENHLKVAKTRATFPSAKPQKNLDLFLLSKGIQLKKADVVQTKLSDHLPVWVEVKKV